MRKISKFSLRKLGRRKGDKLLLSDSQERGTSDFTSGVELGREESRNDMNASWQPYPVPAKTTNIEDVMLERQPTDKPRDATTEESSSIHHDESVDKYEQKVVDPHRSQEAHMQNCERIVSEKNQSFVQFTVNASADVFQDLESESVKEELLLSQDSLEDIMDNDDPTIQRVSVKSFRIDSESSESSNLKRRQSEREIEDSIESSCRSSHSNPVNVEIDHRYSKKRGILIVDPNNNGEIYRMDENNKELTDKELIIIGGNRDGEDARDDETLMSSLTEVTYQRSKEERMKHIMENLKVAASNIPESRAWCGMFEQSASFDDRNGTNMNGRSIVSKDRRDLSLSQSTKLIFNSLFTKSGDKVDLGSFSEQIVVCITRIYLSLSLQEGATDNGLRCTHNEPKLCHDFGVRLEEAVDGQAIVVGVLPESTAARSGVEVGDVLSFAVPLNNTFQGYEKACDFISRLELIGMRTSYREIFDMFLSKTSSGWPVASVFKRQSRAMKSFEQLPLGLLSVDLNIDLSRAASFFHEIVTRSREYDYYLDSNGACEVVRGNIEAFIPKPQCRSSRKRTKFKGADEAKEAAGSFGLNTDKKSRTIFLPMVLDRNDHHQPMFFPDTRRSSLLTWYTENSDSIIYLKFHGTFGGAGISVFRTSGGLWSAPCAIKGNIRGAGFRPNANPIEFMIFIRDLSDIDELKKDKEVTIGGQDQKEKICVVSNIADRFYMENNFICSCISRKEINALLYSKYHSNTSTEQILSGKLPTPSDAGTFCGALRRLELPSTMYPHPTPPNNLVKFNLNNWTKDESCKSSGSLDPPFEDKTIATLKDFLHTLENSESIYTDELNEFEVFTQKFNQMLYDGVTIDRVWPTENERGSQDDSPTSKITLKLDSKATNIGTEHFLLFIAKSHKSRKGISSDFTKPTDLSKNKYLSESLKLHNVVEISQHMPINFKLPQLSSQEKKKWRKRFVSLKTNDGKSIWFLARTGKDASLLACGLKLIVERSCE